MTDTVAVIVCTYLDERTGQLQAALASLRRQTRPPDEIVVVVDGNSRLADELRREAHDFSVTELMDRSGLAAARNQGVSVSSSDIVLFLDDDARAHPSWVELLGSVIAEPHVLGASGWSDPRWLAKRRGWMPDEFLWMLGCSYKGMPTERHTVRNVYGGCCGLRRSMFEMLGGYDTRFGRGPGSTGGGEEAEFCLRAQTRWPDWTFVQEPAARITHDVGPERTRLSYLLRRATGEGLMKAAVRRQHRGALSPELGFARALPAAICREAAAGLRGDRDAAQRAVVMLVLSAAVLVGLLRGLTIAPVLPPPRADSSTPERFPARPLPTRVKG